MRSIGPGVRGAAPVGARMAAQFAARIAGRHARRTMRSGISLPLAASTRVMATNVVHRHTRFGDVIQARLQMHLQVHRAVIVAATAAAFRERVADAGGGRRPDVDTAAPAVRRHRLSIAERLPLRAARVEAATATAGRSVAAESAPGTPILSAAAPSRPTRPAAMTLVQRNDRARQTDQAVIAAAHADHETRDARSSQTPRVGHPRHVHAPVVPDGEIERLAERVIGSIDRRIAAQRERVGRF